MITSIEGDENAYEISREIETLLCDHYDFVIELHKMIERKYSSASDIKEEISRYSSLIDQANMIYKQNKYRKFPNIKELTVWRDVLKCLLIIIGSHKKYSSLNQLVNLFKMLKSYLPKQLANLKDDENFIRLRNEFLDNT